MNQELIHVPRPQVDATESLEAEIIMKLRSGVALSEAIPWEMQTQDVLRWILACGALLARADRMSSVVRPALGRLMLMARKDPEFLPAAECKELRDFEKKLTEQTGYSRSSLHQCLQVHDWAGDLLTTEYEECGWYNLLLLARNSKGASDKQKREMLDAAKGRSTKELREWLDESGIATKGQTTTAALTLVGSQEDVQELRAWLGRPDIQASAGTMDPLGILIAASQELDPWPGTGEHQQ